MQHIFCRWMALGRSRLFSWLLMGLGSLVLLSCNEHPLRSFRAVLDKLQSDAPASQNKTLIDVLWVVDDSGSMCQEQNNLARNFQGFLEFLSTLDADFKMGVITTDVNDAKKPDGTLVNPFRGQLRNTPATSMSRCVQADGQNSANFCLDDRACGMGGCLCGIPHLRRCTSDDDCGGDTPVCVKSASFGSFQFCSRACEGPSDESCLVPGEPNGVFACKQAPGRAEGHYCLLRTCLTDADCPVAPDPNKQSYACEAHADEPGVSYCRRQENYNFDCANGRCPHGGTCSENNESKKCISHYKVCPAPTCDCPIQLPPVLELCLRGDEGAGGAGGGKGDTCVSSLADAVTRFRCMATVGTNGDNVERGLESIELFLGLDRAKPECDGTVDSATCRFLRPDAHLVIVILSDEDDCSGEEELPAVGLSNCVWYKERLRPVDEFVKQVKALKDEPLRVVVSTIVGERFLICSEACPNSDGINCSPSDACTIPCPDGKICAERTFKYNEELRLKQDPVASCTSENGIAFSGARYLEFASAFDSWGIQDSICKDSFKDALELVADIIVTLPQVTCLAAPLRECEAGNDAANCPANAELGQSVCASFWDANKQAGAARCVSPNGEVGGWCDHGTPDSCEAPAVCTVRNVCRWVNPAGKIGNPADLKIWVQRKGQAEGSYLDTWADWTFEPRGDGCIKWLSGKAPGVGDQVEFRYVSQVEL